MSKWWARRRSSVFRSMLIAAATKAPDDPSHAAKLVWDIYYANHQKKGAFKHLKVADIFMGGGTTLVEGSRLGMQMFGNDLNPVAWFVVKQELANVDLEEVKQLLADIEAEVKPQIMPFYSCDGPNGEKGKWTHLPTKRVMPADFDPLHLDAEQRKDYQLRRPRDHLHVLGQARPVSGDGLRPPHADHVQPGDGGEDAHRQALGTHLRQVRQRRSMSRKKPRAWRPTCRCTSRRRVPVLRARPQEGRRLPALRPHRAGQAGQGQEQEGGTEPAGASAMAGG